MAQAWITGRTRTSMSNWLSESVFGQAVLAWMKAIRYAIISDPEIVTDEVATGREHRTG
jgi:hypothetical protein